MFLKKGRTNIIIYVPFHSCFLFLLDSFILKILCYLSSLVIMNTEKKNRRVGDELNIRVTLTMLTQA